MATIRRVNLRKHLRSIRRSTRLIARAFGKLETRLRRIEGKASRVGKAVSRKGGKIRLTAKRRAQLKLQGAYMGYMRQLKPAQKLRVKAVKEKRGFEAAIRMARSLSAK